MPVVSHSLRLVYLDVPKVGCTTLKVLFWELEHGRRFRTPRWVRLLRRAKLNVRASAGNIHDTSGYRTWSFARCRREFTIPEGYSRLTVLRDPIDRVFSAWKSKARPGVFAARDEVEDLLNEGLSNFFVAKTHKIREVWWDEELKLQEHMDFFWRARKSLRCTYLPYFSSVNSHAKESAEYGRFRSRSEDFQKLQCKKLGVRRIISRDGRANYTKKNVCRTALKPPALYRCFAMFERVLPWMPTVR